MPHPDEVFLDRMLRRLRAAGAAVRAKFGGGGAQRREIDRLTDELHVARERNSAQSRVMRAEHDRAMASLKASEEETQSSNEALQGSDEELETAMEHLQALNEALSTTNDELRVRNRELKLLHDEVTQGRDFADAIIETM